MSEQEKCMDHSDCNWKGCAFMGEMQADLARLVAENAALVKTLRNIINANSITTYQKCPCDQCTAVAESRDVLAAISKERK